MLAGARPCELMGRALQCKLLAEARPSELMGRARQSERLSRARPCELREELVRVNLLGLALWARGNVACVGLTPQVV